MIVLSLVLMTLFTSCEKDLGEGGFLCPKVPNAPYGQPDDTDKYSNSSGYASITYVYYCLNGKYQSITWTRSDKCGVWRKSVYTSSCLN